VNKVRIRFKLKSGQWTYWLSADEVARYRNDFIESAVIEETMSYEEAMKMLGKKELSAEKP
jgi:hypothetical protein